jgi:hypothetical protein
MYQGPNFNSGTKKIKPARESGIWCPTENLSGFDLAIGDRILFFKTIGGSSQDVQKLFLSNQEIYSTWKLEEIWIGEITSKIYSRDEYCQYKKMPIVNQLWKNDSQKEGDWRWSRVFEFKKIKNTKTEILIANLYSKNQEFVTKMVEAFCYGKSREV